MQLRWTIITIYRVSTYIVPTSINLSELVLYKCPTACRKIGDKNENNDGDLYIYYVKPGIAMD